MGYRAKPFLTKVKEITKHTTSLNDLDQQANNNKTSTKPGLVTAKMLAPKRPREDPEFKV